MNQRGINHIVKLYRAAHSDGGSGSALAGMDPQYIQDDMSTVIDRMYMYTYFSIVNSLVSGEAEAMRHVLYPFSPTKLVSLSWQLTIGNIASTEIWP